MKERKKRKENTGRSHTSISLQMLVVEESIQIGLCSTENASESCGDSSPLGSRLLSVTAAFFFQYTLPCCWPDAETAVTEAKSKFSAQ
jgi:hypothetical protein